MDAEKIRKEFGYEGKPKQWQVGFDALLRHMPDYQKETSGDKSALNDLVMCSVTNESRKLSRQYHDQQENLKNGECIFCRKPLLTKRHCKKCAEKVRTMARNRYRKKAGIKLDAPLYGPRRKIST